MATDQIQRAISGDGTEIAGHVHGQGPPLVLVHGGIGSEESWRFLVPYLGERFTCYPMSLRGRGLSAENLNHAPEHLIEDVVAFVDSVGEPVGLVGHSSGGALALAAATHAERVTSIAVYEPALPELDAEIRARYQDAFVRMEHAAAQGRLSDAAQIALEDCALANDEELAVLAAAGAAQFVAPNVPVHIRDRDVVTHRFLEAGRLQRLTMPILLMHGSDTHSFFKGVVRHLADRVADPLVSEVDRAGHMAPLLVPDAVADEIARFFAPAPTRS